MAIARNDTATLFSEGTASTLRLIVYLALAAILMVLDHRSGYLETLRRYSGAVVEPAYRIAAFPADVARARHSAREQSGASADAPVPASSQMPPRPCGSTQSSCAIATRAEPAISAAATTKPWSRHLHEKANLGLSIVGR